MISSHVICLISVSVPMSHQNLDRVTSAVLSLQFLWPGASIREPFLESVRDIDDLKFRLSWGKTGSTNVSDFSYIQYFNGNQYGGQSGLTLASTYPNKDIKWEMTTEYNAGVDFTLFNGRLNW